MTEYPYQDAAVDIAERVETSSRVVASDGAATESSTREPSAFIVMIG